MYALIIGRAFPDKKTGMMGIFEFEQAFTLNKFGFKSVYAFCDTRSIKKLKIFNYIECKSNNIPIYGYHFPIGGIPRKIYEHIKKEKFKKLLNRIIENEGKPSIIHIHFPLINLNMDIWDLIRQLNIPIIVTEHWSKVQQKKIEPYRLQLLNKIVEESNNFICVGTNLKKSILELTNTSKEIQVIPNFVSPIFYYKKGIESKKRFNFIAIGRLVETKRFEFLIDVFTETFAENKNIMLNIVGNGPLYKKLYKKIDMLDMNDRIILHGFLPRDKTAEAIRKSSAFVSTSIIETFGVPIIESMACGKPIISVENGPLDHYINESNGELFKKDNKSSLKKSLLAVYKKRAEYDGDNISRNTSAIFGESTVIQQLINIYDNELRL